MKKKIAVVAAITAVALAGFAPAAFAGDRHHGGHDRGHDRTQDLGDVLDNLLDVVGNLL